MGALKGDAIVAWLKAWDIEARVEQTGGGTATIFAGPEHYDPEWGTRYAAVAGPGWFEGPGWTDSRFEAEELSVSFDDGGRSDADYGTDDDTEASIAELIAARVERWQAR